MNTEKALAVLPFVGVLARDREGRPITVQVPATVRVDGGKRQAPRVAVVKITRNGAATMTCTHYESDADAGTPCIAIEQGHICYHCLAALFVAAKDSGHYLTVHHSHSIATDNVKAGGRVIVVRAGTAEVYAVLNPRGTVKAIAPAVVAPPVPPPSPGPEQCQCGSVLDGATQIERGLCPRCDRSFSTKRVKPVVLK